ncbi:hypothetical protein COLO4_23946 [Corchorus olitorius]|uniref:Uncharacterized protein n=1 Tax=Corchorus olitorius TaxID=93759 RepID=A0A1R3IDX2_9ROSI|nr:hypothetical protein COLO4_23946 [Corchorus olitorius]
MGCDMDADFEVFYAPPFEVMDALEADRRGVTFPRSFKLS